MFVPQTVEYPQQYTNPTRDTPIVRTTTHLYTRTYIPIPHPVPVLPSRTYIPPHTHSVHRCGLLRLLYPTLLFPLEVVEFQGRRGCQSRVSESTPVRSPWVFTYIFWVPVCKEGQEGDRRWCPRVHLGYRGTPWTSPVRVCALTLCTRVHVESGSTGAHRHTWATRVCV